MSLHKTAIATSILAALFWVTAFGRAGAQYAGWVLKQYSSYYGQVTAYITPTVSVVKTDLGTAYIPAAGANFVMFNDKNRTIYEVAKAEWQAKITNHMSGVFGSLETKVGAEPIAGIQTTHYKLFSDQTSNYLLGEYWTTTGIGGSPAMNAALAHFFGLPSKLGFPVRLVRRSPKYLVALDTRQVERASIPSSVFKVPTDYRRVYDEVTFMLDEGAGKDVFRDLETTRPGR